MRNSPVQLFHTFILFTNSYVLVKIAGRFGVMRRVCFYAVARGRSVGVFNTWQKCSDSTNGFSGAKFRKFPTMEQAKEFVKRHSEAVTAGANAIAKKGFGQPKPLKLSAKIQTTAIDTAKSQRGPSTQRTVTVGNEATNSALDDGLTAIVYTDGACSRNGFIGAKAGFGVFWSDGHPDNVFAPVTGLPTNNRAEFLAVIAALEKAIARNIRQLIVRTDSALLIKSLTKWLPKWRRNGWKTINGKDVQNRDLLEQLDKLMKLNIDVKLEKVAGHSGDYGNDQADLLARKGAEMYMPDK